jgi:hypothetical protein
MTDWDLALFSDMLTRLTKDAFATEKEEIADE